MFAQLSNEVFQLILDFVAHKVLANLIVLLLLPES